MSENELHERLELAEAVMRAMAMALTDHTAKAEGGGPCFCGVATFGVRPCNDTAKCRRGLEAMSAWTAYDGMRRGGYVGYHQSRTLKECREKHGGKA